MPTLLRHHCRLDLSSHRTTCGIIADLWLTATFPLLWDLAASFDEAVRDQNLSLFLQHHCRLAVASSPTFICAHRRLRLHCRLNLYRYVVLIFIVAYPLLWSSCSSSWDQTIINCARLCVLSCGIIAGLDRRLVGRLAALMADLNRRLIERLAASPPS
jgi:hypothetical protein